MSILSSWVKNVIVFMILFTAARNLVSNSKYAKYINFIFGLLLVILIAEPVLDFAGDKASFGLNFEKNLVISEHRERDAIFKAAEEKQSKKMIEEYVSILSGQAQLILDKHGYEATELEFRVVEDSAAEDYGSVREISCKVCSLEANESFRGDRDAYEIGLKTDSAEELFVKNLLADFYRISIDNINISIQEEQDGG